MVSLNTLCSVFRVMALGLLLTNKLVNLCYIAELDEKSFQECGNTGFAMKCNNTGLKTVPQWYPPPSPPFSPPLCLLDLSENNFTILANGSFVHAKNLNPSEVLWLYLTFCNLNFIASNSFQNFTSLLYLNLTGNILSTPNSLEPGVFKPLKSLKNINLKENKFTTFKQLGQELQYLKGLEGLFVDLCEGCDFGREFENLTNLVCLSLSGRSKDACHASLITNDTFKYVIYLKKLLISSCHIRTIEADAFSHLQYLELLDISYNEELTFAGMNIALYGIRNSSSLKELNVNRIHTLWETGIQLNFEDITYLKTLRALEILHMDLNKIEVFDERIMNPYQLPSSLRDFTLSGNRLTYGKYMHYFHDVTNITTLDISRQHLNLDPFIQNHFPYLTKLDRTWSADALNQDDNLFTAELCQPTACQNSSLICLPPDLRTLIWRQSFVYFQIDKLMIVCGATNLRHLDLSNNLITKWRAPVLGLQYITHLDLSENLCDEATYKFFEVLPSVTHLNLSGNYLRHSLDPMLPEAGHMFSEMTRIKVLDLSRNKIKALSPDLFMNLKNLSHLHLKENILEQWNSTFDTNTCLKTLDLSQNKLSTLPTFLTDYLDQLVSNSCVIHLHLNANPLECSCKSLPFLRWTTKTEVNIHFADQDVCRLNGDRYSLTSEHDMETIIHLLETDVCVDRNKYSWIISVASSTVTAFLSILICGLVYRSRWKIRYIYYSRNRRYIHEGYDHLFENDAFVSYAKDNASFIKNSMVPSLEQQHDLRLWVADRNSLAGNSIAENITHAIYNSRKVVLLVDKAYLKDKWCDYEMNMALMESIETKRKMLIILLYEQMPYEDLPLSLLNLLRTERSLEYPYQEQDIGTFWTNLADEIRSN